MFRDESERIKEDVEDALETYSFEEILDHNDVTLEEVLTMLVENGYLTLPEIRRVR